MKKKDKVRRRRIRLEEEELGWKTKKKNKFGRRRIRLEDEEEE